MISKKYINDYTFEYSTASNGKLIQTAIYKGKYFQFAFSQAEVKSVTRMSAFLTFVCWVTYIVPLLPVSSASRSLYVIIPHACLFLPIIFLTFSVFALWTTKPPMTREKSDQITHSGPKSLLVIIIFSSLAISGLLFRFTDWSSLVFPGDIIFGICEIILLISSILLFRNKKFIATCESGS